MQLKMLEREKFGTVRRVLVDKGFGFIRIDGGTTEVFFHVRDCDRRIQFDEQLLERRVLFDVVETDRGMRAANVRPA